MEDRGIVKKIQDGIAIVQITGPEECSSCVMRKLCNPSGGAKEIQAQNKIGAKTGDEVVVFIPEGIGWLSVFINFTIPVILLIAGIIIGKILFGKDIYSFLTGIGVILLYALVLIPVDRKMKDKRYIPYIKEIIKPSTDQGLYDL